MDFFPRGLMSARYTDWANTRLHQHFYYNPMSTRFSCLGRKYATCCSSLCLPVLQLHVVVTKLPLHSFFSPFIFFFLIKMKAQKSYCLHSVSCRSFAFTWKPLFFIALHSHEAAESQLLTNPIILWNLCLCWQSPHVALFFLVEYIQNMSLKCLQEVKTHGSPEIFRYKPSTIHNDAPSLPSSTLTQGKEYAGG